MVEYRRKRGIMSLSVNPYLEERGGKDIFLNLYPKEEKASLRMPKERGKRRKREGKCPCASGKKKKKASVILSRREKKEVGSHPCGCIVSESPGKKKRKGKLNSLGERKKKTVPDSSR